MHLSCINVNTRMERKKGEKTHHNLGIAHTYIEGEGERERHTHTHTPKRETENIYHSIAKRNHLAMEGGLFLFFASMKQEISDCALGFFL